MIEFIICVLFGMLPAGYVIAMTTHMMWADKQDPWLECPTLLYMLSALLWPVYHLSRVADPLLLAASDDIGEIR